MLIEKRINTSNREEIIDITGEVIKEIQSNNIEQGVCVVFVPHTTCAITINESADPDVKRDILTWMKKQIPRAGDYKHFEGNSDAHLKTMLTGQSVQMIIENRQLMLGTWQALYFCEYDGPRKRKYWIKII